jgi:hypothetical protein
MWLPVSDDQRFTRDVYYYVLFLRVQRCAVGLFPARKQVIVGSNPRRGI